MRLAHRGTRPSALAALLLGLGALACGDTHTLAVGGPGGSAGTGSGTMPVPDPSRDGQPDSPQPGQPGNPTPTRPTTTTGSGAVPVPPPPSIHFNARLEGDLIVVDVDSSIRLSMETCSDGIALEKFEPTNDAWVAPRDDRPPANQNPGYYLDGAFEPPRFDAGCDFRTCAPFPITSNRVVIAPAYEYMRTGTAAPPAGVDGVPAQVDVIERRPLSGDLRIRIDYFQDASCQIPSSALIELVVPPPDHGVCCPIGIAQCSTEGPLGGWAPSLAECQPYEMAWDVSFEQRVDPRGCPVLVEEPDVCCGCVPDADGGL